MLRKIKKSFRLILGLVFVGSVILVSSSQQAPANAEKLSPKTKEQLTAQGIPQPVNVEKICQKDKKQVASVQQQCTESDDFLYSDCTGFYE